MRFWAYNKRFGTSLFRMFRSPSRIDFPFFRKRYPVLDPRYFDDPVAMRTGWEPLSPGGSRYTTNRLRESALQVLSFQPTAYRHYRHRPPGAVFGNALIAAFCATSSISTS